MTRKVRVVLQDDIDGTEPARTVRFGLDGREYQIDLNNEHEAALRQVLAPWIAHARRTMVARFPEPRGAGDAGGPADATVIRRWAAERGIDVRERGRIPAAVRAQYEAEQLSGS
jgi:hypothetical protein